MPARLQGVLSVEMMGEGTPITSTLNASGDTSLISATSGRRIKIKGLMASNESDTDLTIKFRFGSSGDYYFRTKVPKDGGTWNWNFINHVWIGALNEAFICNVDTASKDISITAIYELV